MTTSNDKIVNSILANIQGQDSPSSTQPEQVQVKEDIAKLVMDLKKPKNTIKGKPKSGKFWKSSREKFSSINSNKALKQSLEKKNALRQELKRTKELSKQVKEQIEQRKMVKKERRRENILKTEEKKKKSEVVQVITNSAKIKRMKKKQLRFIEKRDISKGSETKINN